MANEYLFSGVQGSGYDPFAGVQGNGQPAQGQTPFMQAMTGNSPQQVPGFTGGLESAPSGAPQTGGADPYVTKPGQAAPTFSFSQGQYTPSAASTGGGSAFGSGGGSPFVTGGSGGGGDMYGGSSSSSGYQQNPYLRDQMAALTGQYQQSFLQNTAPQLRAGAMASGQYGGSRQGIAEGIAQGNAATGLASALGQLQAGTYQTDTNNWLQNKSLNNQYALGLGNLGLGFQNSNNNFMLGQGQLALTNQGQNQNFYTNQRNTDLEQMRLGATLANNGVTGQQAIGQGQYGLGNVYQQAPMQAIQTYNQQLQPWANTGNTTTTSGGGGASGAMGGAMAGMNIASRLNFGGGGNMPMVNGGGISNLPSYLLMG